MHEALIASEVVSLLAHGAKQVSMVRFREELAEIGYRLDDSMACRSMARYMTGPRAGETYPACSLYARQIDNGVSCANVDARRDANYEAFKVLRNTRFAISQGYIATL